MASKYTLLHIRFLDCRQIINWEGKNEDIALHGVQKVSQVRLCGEIGEKKKERKIRREIAKVCLTD